MVTKRPVRGFGVVQMRNGSGVEQWGGEKRAGLRFIFWEVEPRLNDGLVGEKT